MQCLVRDGKDHDACCIRRDFVLLIVNGNAGGGQIIMFFIKILYDQFRVIFKEDSRIPLYPLVGLFEDLPGQQCAEILAGREEAGHWDAASVREIPGIGRPDGAPVCAACVLILVAVQTQMTILVVGDLVFQDGIIAVKGEFVFLRAFVGDNSLLV